MSHIQSGHYFEINTLCKTVCVAFTVLGVYAVQAEELTAKDLLVNGSVVNESDRVLAQRVGMVPMDSAAMESIVAQGSVRDDFQYLIDVYDGGPQDEAPVKAVTAFFQTVLPMFEYLTDYTISDVEFRDPANSPVIANPDGSITVMLPSRIGEIAYRDLSVKGFESSPLGDLVFSDIRTLEGSKIILTRAQP